MQTNPRPTRRRLVFGALALLAISAAGAIAGDFPQEEASQARDGHRAVAEAELVLARARRDAAELGVKIAQAHASAAAADREYREKQHGRIAELQKAGSVEQKLVDEEEGHVRGARAAERSAGLSVEIARGRLTVAEAAIREAQAIHDLARIGSGILPAVQAENDLEEARSERADARHRVEHAEAEEARAEAFRLFRKKEYDRLNLLASKNAIERRVIDEQEDRYRTALADERQAEAKVDQAMASVAIAEAAVRVAEARRDLARSVARLASAPGAAKEPADLKEPMARLRRARVDRARAEREVARLEVSRADADAERDRAAVATRAKELERVKQLAARRAGEDRLVDEHELSLTESRHILRQSEAAVKSARARLESAEARLKAIEAEGREASPPAGKAPEPAGR